MTRQGSEESREQILEAARQVFFEKGYERASIRDIEMASGLTRGAIYYHFRGKEEIYLVVLTGGMRLLREELEATAADREQDPRRQVVALLRTYCEFYRARPQFFRIAQHFFFAREVGADLDPRILQEVIEIVSECLQLITKAIDQGMKQGAFASRDPFFETVLIWSMATNVVQLTEENPRAAFLRLAWDDMMARLEQSLLDHLCGVSPAGDGE